MSIFICDEDNCPNAGVIYNFGDDHPVRAECGGCQTTLLPEKED
jgi:ribosomal protein S27AE